MKVFSSIMLLLLLSFACAGQVFSPSTDILTITTLWTSTAVHDLKSGDQFAFASQLKAHGSTKIDWIQKLGQEVFTFDIESTDGSWADFNAAGSVIHHVTYQGKTGKITFQRTTANVLHATLELSEPNAISFSLSISAAAIVK